MEIRQIQRLCEAGKIKWSIHSAEMMHKRGENEMTNCFFCKKGTLEETVTTYMVDLKDCIIIVKNVPCEECSLCGEKFFSDSVMQRLDEIVQKARDLASEVFVTDFSKKAA